jgi:hypothetical protein
LGVWINKGHQKWASLYDQASQALYIEGVTGWVKHLPIYLPTVQTTRAAVKPWYDIDVYVPTAMVQLDLVPASILHDPTTDGSLFQISIGTLQQCRESETAHSDHFIVGDSPGDFLPHPIIKSYCSGIQPTSPPEWMTLHKPFSVQIYIYVQMAHSGRRLAKHRTPGFSLLVNKKYCGKEQVLP